MATRSARLIGFMTDGYPGSGLQVQALAEDHVGTYILPFPCECINEEWRNGMTGEPVEARVIGWREFPRQPRGRIRSARELTEE